MNSVPKDAINPTPKSRPGTVWTEDMIARLKKAYSEGGMHRAYEAFPELSNDVVRRAAFKYGIHSKLVLRPWETWEDDCLKQTYSSLGPGPGAIAQLRHLNRTKYDIIERARALGLLQPKSSNRPWTKEEDQFLIKYLSTLGTTGMSNRLKRKLDTVLQRAVFLMQQKASINHEKKKIKRP